MYPLTTLIKQDMKPAFGVTEPGAIAFAAAKAKSYTDGRVKRVELELNSGIYKNAFTCGIPGTSQTGIIYAAALGLASGDPAKELEVLSELPEQAYRQADEIVSSGIICVKMREVCSDIYISARVMAGNDVCEVIIEHSHVNVTEIHKNGTQIYRKEQQNTKQAESLNIHKYGLKDIYEYITSVPIEQISFQKSAYDLNMELFEEGLKTDSSRFIKVLKSQNGGKIFSDDIQKTAQLLCNGAIEARVTGLGKAAMSITGSGAHGIICTLPLYACYKAEAVSEEQLLRATALSYLITMYIKEYSGKLSAFCGCGIAAGTGMACAYTWLLGGGIKEIEATIQNMASGITGMICDGGNQGCVMKGITAVDTAFQSAKLAMAGVCVDKVHGINGTTPEQTMKNMGRIASPGMVKTEEVIVSIMEEKI